jgi:hypothetical protein
MGHRNGTQGKSKTVAALRSQRNGNGANHGRQCGRAEGISATVQTPSRRIGRAPMSLRSNIGHIQRYFFQWRVQPPKYLNRQNDGPTWWSHEVRTGRGWTDSSGGGRIVTVSPPPPRLWTAGWQQPSKSYGPRSLCEESWSPGSAHSELDYLPSWSFTVG